MFSPKTRRLIGVLIFGLAFLLLGAWMVGWIPSQAEYCEQNPYTEHEKCTSYQIAIAAVRYIARALDSVSAALTAIATVLIGAFTYTLYKSTAGLKDATDKLWDAGERQITLATDTAQRQLRAYVLVNGVIRTKNPGDMGGEGFSVLLDIKNNGQTPAYNLLQWARIEIREFPLTSYLPIHCLENPTRVVLPPDSKTMAFPVFRRGLTTIEENAVLADHTAIYVYGEIDYYDAFGRRHLTQFRFRCNGQGYPMGLFKADAEGNEAD